MSNQSQQGISLLFSLLLSLLLLLSRLPKKLLLLFTHFQLSWDLLHEQSESARNLSPFFSLVVVVVVVVKAAEEASPALYPFPSVLESLT